MSLEQLIVQTGFATDAEVKAALAAARGGGDVVTHLIATTQIDEPTWLVLLSDALGLEAERPGPLPPPTPEAASLVPRGLLSQARVVPLRVDGDRLVVAVSRPLSPDLEAMISTACGRALWQRIALDVRIEEALAKAGGAPQKHAALLKKLDATAPRPAAVAPPPPPSTRASKAPDSAAHPFVATALDAIDKMDDKDEILAALFDVTTRLFKFAALFVVSGEVAEGRFVHGAKGDVAIAKIHVPLPGPSVLAKARDHGALLTVKPEPSGFDKLLFAQLKYAPKDAVVVTPLIVRKRAVAFLVADHGGGQLPPSTGAALAAVTHAAGHRFESIIWRRKLKQGEASSNSERDITKFLGVPSSSRLPRSPADASGPSSIAPSSSAPPASAAPSIDFLPPASVAPPAPRPAGGRVGLLAAGAALLLGLGAVGVYAATRSPSGARAGAADVPDQADPLSLLETARGYADLKKDAKLAAIEARVDAEGKVHFDRAVDDDLGAPLSFTFVSGGKVVAVDVEKEGFNAREVDPKLNACDGKPCVLPKERPHCAVSALWQEALKFGAVKTDRARVSLVAAGGPVAWRFAVKNRGMMSISDETCQRVARTRLLPAARAAADIPGAPHSVEPLGLLEVARAHSGLEDDAVLVELAVTFVDSTGRVDLEGSRRLGSVSYTFADPPGAPGKPRRRRVLVNRTGMDVAADLDAAPYDAVPPPKCTLLDVLRKVPEAVGTDETMLTYRARPELKPVIGEWWVRVRTSSHTVLDFECSERSPAPPPPAPPKR